MAEEAIEWECIGMFSCYTFVPEHLLSFLKKVARPMDPTMTTHLAAGSHTATALTFSGYVPV